jgi:hypothetical protein
MFQRKLEQFVSLIFLAFVHHIDINGAKSMVLKRMLKTRKQIGRVNEP